MSPPHKSARRLAIMIGGALQLAMLGGAAYYAFQQWQFQVAAKPFKRLGDATIDRLEGWDAWRGREAIDGARLDGTDTTDMDLEHLIGHVNSLSNFAALSLGNTRVTDDGLKHVSRMTWLRSLNLRGTQITDAGLAHLRDLPDLRYLTLDETMITDDGLRYLADIRDLTELSLANTRIAGRGLRYLRRLRQLKTLRISDTPITDVDLEQIPRVRTLHAENTAITDAGLEHLNERVGEWLYVSGTKVTPKGIAKLAQSRPRLVINGRSYEDSSASWRNAEEAEKP